MTAEPTADLVQLRAEAEALIGTTFAGLCEIEALITSGGTGTLYRPKHSILFQLYRDRIACVGHNHYIAWLQIAVDNVWTIALRAESADLYDIWELSILTAQVRSISVWRRLMKSPNHTNFPALHPVASPAPRIHEPGTVQWTQVGCALRYLFTRMSDVRVT